MAPVEFVMINNYLIDVAVKEDHTFTNEVTDYPVESGGSLSDNIRPKPITVTLEGIVSNSPLGQIATSRRTFAGPLATGQASSAEAYALLLAVWNGREPVTIRTSLATFERMALTSLTIPKSKDTGDALHFTAAFQQITVVTNEAYKVGKRVSIPNGGKKRDRGPQSVASMTSRRIKWRKGRPPGTHSVTEVEELTWELRPGTTGVLLHAFSGVELTGTEYRHYKLDDDRDRSDRERGYTPGFYLGEFSSSATPAASPGRFDANIKTVTKKPVPLKYGSGFDPLVSAFKRPFS